MKNDPFLAVALKQRAALSAFALLMPVGFVHASGSDSVVGALNNELRGYIVAELSSAAGMEKVSDNWSDQRTTLAKSLEQALRSEVSTSLRLNEKSSFNTQIKSGFVGTGTSNFEGLGVLGASQGFALREQFAPSLVQQIGDQGELSVGGVFVYESLGGQSYGQTIRRDAITGEAPIDRSSGSGLTIGWQSAAFALPLGDLKYGFSGQSRINMDAYERFIGVFGTEAEFDLPGRFGAQLSFETRFGEFQAGIERVQYSKVDAFSATSLPDQFVSLLGDSGSPRFEWQDLSIYSASYAFAPFGKDRLALTVTTSQQPAPESLILRNALDLDRSPNVSLNYAMQFSPSSRLRFVTRFAPDSYFFGPSVLTDADFGGKAHLEGEARFELSF